MRTTWAILTLLLVASPALGQDYRPVDQTVEDLDPLAVSQRVIQGSPAVFSDRTSLYRPLDPLMTDPFGRPASQSYILEKPGVRAWVNRPDYLVLVDPDPQHPKFNINVQPVIDGAYTELVPPGTVFDLTLPVQRSLMDRHPELDTRLDYRLDMRIGGRIDPVNGPMPKPILGYGNAILIEPSVAAPPRVVRPRQEAAPRAIPSDEDAAEQ